MSGKGFLISGFRWHASSHFLRQVIQWVTVIFLVRILSPEDFGIFSMIMVAVGFATVLRDLGTSAALVQKEEVSDELLSSVFWLNIVVGTVCTAILTLLAPAISMLYGENAVSGPLMLLSIVFIIAAPGHTHKALLERGMDFRKLAYIETASAAVGSAAAIAAALKGLGLWSLIIQSIAMNLSMTAGFVIISRWLPKAHFSLDDIRSVSEFSLNLTGFNIFNFFIRNADYLLIGRYLGANQLGYYTLAYQIMLYPLHNISSIVGRVMFPYYSRLRNNVPEIRSTYLKVCGAIAFITFPMMLGLMSVSSPFVLAVFGEKWLPVALLLVILAPEGMLQSVETTVSSIYYSRGRTDLFFRWELFSGILIILGFVAGLRWGIVGVAASYVIINMILAYPGLAIPLRLIQLKVSDITHSIKRPFVLSAAMALLVFLLRNLLPQGQSTMFHFLVPVSFGVTAYIFLTLVFNRKQAIEIIKTMGSKHAA